MKKQFDAALTIDQRDLDAAMENFPGVLSAPWISRLSIVRKGLKTAPADDRRPLLAIIASHLVTTAVISCTDRLDRALDDINMLVNSYLENRLPLTYNALIYAIDEAEEIAFQDMSDGRGPLVMS